MVKHLTRNMLAQTLWAEGANHFSELLLEIREGKMRIEEKQLTTVIPEGIKKVVTK